MTRRTLGQVVAATGGELLGTIAPSVCIRRVAADPAEVGAGDLFVAVAGEPLDGHELIPVAALRGAVAAVVSREWARRVRELPLPLVVVDDPVTALQRLAAAHRDRLEDLLVVGVTGSVGKTSTKEVVASVLGRRFATYRSPGNRNNELGVPLSMLEIEPGTEVAVLELGGAYAPGELALLARIVRPTIGVVTNVFPVHLERMGSIEAIARTKAEVIESLPTNGIAVLHGDDARVRAMASACRGRVLTYGRNATNDVRAEAIVLRGLDGCSFRVDLGLEQGEIELPLLGEHAVELALAGLTVGHALGMSIAEMLSGVKDPGAQIRLRRRTGANGSLLLDDTYNASTPSMLSALGLLAHSGARRKVAVLGDMLELGALAEQEHEIVGQRAGEVVDVLVTYGDLARIIAESAGARARARPRRPEVRHFEPGRRSDLVGYLQETVRNGDVVLVKGSRSLRMEELVEALSVSREPA